MGFGVDLGRKKTGKIWYQGSSGRKKLGKLGIRAVLGRKVLRKVNFGLSRARESAGSGRPGRGEGFSGRKTVAKIEISPFRSIFEEFKIQISPFRSIFRSLKSKITRF